MVTILVCAITYYTSGTSNASTGSIAEIKLAITASQVTSFATHNLDNLKKRHISKIRDAKKNRKIVKHTSQVGSGKRILFYNPAMYQSSRNIKIESRFFFQNCEIKKCVMWFNKKLVNNSDAVILTSWKGVDLVKQPGQVWITLQGESPRTHTKLAQPKAPIFSKDKVNWTMGYSKSADIYLPFGRMRQLPEEVTPHRDYFKIAKSKTKDAIWIVSHCDTLSKRELYVEVLKQYISVDILGACGEKWDCGRRLVHDQCFDIYNSTYRYSIAFENTLCQDYITEKFFDNYKYDILQVRRGGNPSRKPINISQEAYINANDFKNAHELGKFLKSLSSDHEKYASMLRKKDEYTVVSYMELFRDAGCEICKRLHSVDKYRSLYTDVSQLMHEKQPCFEPDDIGAAS